MYFVNLFINKNRKRVIKNVSLVYVYENQHKEYYVNYEEIKTYILNKYKLYKNRFSCLLGLQLII